MVNQVIVGAQTFLVIFAVLLIGGGAMGFVKAKSKASLIAGSVSGVLIAVCFVLTLIKPATGFVGSFMVATILDGIFAVRLIKTKKFMPSGLLLILSIVCQVLSILAAVVVSKH